MSIDGLVTVGPRNLPYDKGYPRPGFPSPYPLTKKGTFESMRNSF